MTDEKTQILLEEIKHHLQKIEKEINKGDSIYYPYLLEQFAFLQKYFYLLSKKVRLEVEV